MHANNPSTPRYKALWILCFVLGFLFLRAYSAPLKQPSGLVSDLQLPSLHREDAVLMSHTSKESTVNILLIGQDRRAGENRARSDCMILCTFHPETSRLIMTSFLRDLYVEIPGYGKNRLNAAYSFGGMPLLKQALQHNFDICVDGSVEVDFARFCTLIDQLGGVSVTLRQDEAQLINSQIPGDLHAGNQLLNGQQALAFARIRTLDEDGDFSRTQRQQAILSAVFQRCKTSTLPELLRLFKEASPLLSTDIRPADAISLIRQLSAGFSRMEIKSQQIPLADSYTYQTIDSMCVLVADMDKNRTFLKKTLEED